MARAPTATISSSPRASRSGAILMSSGRRGSVSSRAATTRSDQVVKRVAPLQVAQAGRVRRGDVDRQIVGERGEGPDAEHVILDAVGRVPVGADIDADHPGRAAGRPPHEARPGPLEAVVVEAEAVDDGRVLVRDGTDAARALPSCGRGVSVPTSTKPKPSFSIAPGTSAFLSNPAASPSGLGNRNPRISTASRGSAGRRLRRRSDLQRVDRRAMRRLRRQTVENRTLRLWRASRLEAPENVAPVRAERSGTRPYDGAHRQGGVEMGKERPAPRGLPAQVRAQALPRRPRPRSNRPGRRTIWPPSPGPARRSKNG